MKEAIKDSTTADNQKIPSKEIDWEGLEKDCEKWCYTLKDSPPPVKVMAWLKTNLNNYLKTK